MPKRNRQALVDLRRARVASLVLRKLSQRDIVAVLGRGMTNPETGRPYSLGTINSDIQHLQAEWRQNALDDLLDHKGRTLAELQEIKKEAWAQKKLRVVLSCLAQEQALLGLNQPDVSLNFEQVLKTYINISPDDWDEELS